MIRRRPPTTSVSLAWAWSESFVRDFATMDDALAAICSSRLAFSLLVSLPARAARPAMIASMSTREYHTSRLPDSARRCISCRYVAPTSRAAVAQSFLEKFWSRPAMTTLAARRLRSHSHGPGSVSSKSLTSNIIDRSGEANRPKLLRWASPQTCVGESRAGRGGQVGCHDQGGAAVEGERGDQHAPVADRHELGHPRAEPVAPTGRPGRVGRRRARRPPAMPAAPGPAPPCRVGTVPSASGAPPSSPISPRASSRCCVVIVPPGRARLREGRQPASTLPSPPRVA